MKAHCIILAAALAFCSCGSTRRVTQTAVHRQLDSVRTGTVRYDSVFVYRDRLTDRSTDTVRVSEVRVEYRYRLLHDTVYSVRTDSVPYAVRVTEVREVPRPATAFDRLCRCCFMLVCAMALAFILKKVRP